MKNFENIKFPRNANIPFHKSIKKTTFIETEEYPKTASIDPKIFIKSTFGIGSKKRVVNLGDELIVLEENVGFKGLWSKVIIKNDDNLFGLRGFILKDSYEPNIQNGGKDSIIANTSQEYLPDDTAKEIDWRKESTGVVFSDNKNAKYCVLVDTNQKTVGDIDALLEDSLYKGLELILKSKGKDHDQETILNFQNNFYLFGTAEAIDVSFRECSYIRVLVTLPKKFLHSSQINDFAGEIVPVPDGSEEGSVNPDPEVNINYIDIDFENKKEYNDFFSNISNPLPPFGVLNKASVVFKSREWILEPINTSLTLENDAVDILKIKDKIDGLILENTSPETLDDIYGTINRQSVVGIKAIFADPKKQNQIVIPEWEGKLNLKIDSTNLKLAYIGFKTKNDLKIPLNNGILNILEDNLIKNKKLINYILQAHASKVKFEFGKAVNTKNEQEINKVRAKYKENILNFINAQDIKENNDVKDTFKDTVEIFSTSPQKDLPQFLITHHYPKIDAMETRPLDITNCVKNDAEILRVLKQNKIPSVLQRYKQIRDQDILKQAEREGDILRSSLARWPNNITDKNLRIILGVDKPPAGLLPIQVLNQYIIPSLQVINLDAILAEILKCNSATLDPRDFTDLLEKYNNAKQKLEDFAAATVCNPYLVAATKKLNTFQLPTLPVYNPNKNIADILTNLVVEIIQQILIIGVRLLLTNSIEACVKDRNKAKNPNGTTSPEENTNNLIDALNNASGNEEKAVEDIVDNLFNLDKANSQNLTAQRAAGKEKLQEFFSDMNCLLTSKELCLLLKNKPVEADTYEVIKSVIRNKYDIFNKKISDSEDIRNLFSSIGSSVDLRICEDIDGELANNVPSNPLCDDGTLQNARREILQNKNIPEDVINAIINDIKEKEKNNVEDILKFLNSDTPFDFNNVPSVLCKKGPNGEVIPPAVSLGVSTGDFKKLTNAMFSRVYDTFDQEALMWSKSSYSLEVQGPKLLVFDEKTGVIKPDEDAIKNIENQSKDSKKTIKPAYIFKDKLDAGSGAFFSNVVPNQFNVKLNGHLQQKLDANLIEEDLRKKVDAANLNLSLFLSDLLLALEAAAGFVAADAINTTLQPSSRKDNFDIVLEKINVFADRNRLALFDNFARSMPGQIDETAHKNIANKFGKNNEATAMYLKENGADTYLVICKYLKSKFNEFLQLSPIFAQVPRQKRRLDNFDYNSNNQTTFEFLSSSLSGVLGEYDQIEKYYKAVFQTSVNYPNYTFQYQGNDNQNSIPGIEAFYERYNFKIFKNEEEYIKVESYQELDSNISNYVKEKIGFNQANPNKLEVFKKFMNVSDESLYTFMAEKIFSNCLENVKKSIFLQTNLIKSPTEKENTDLTSKIENSSKLQDITKAYTDFLQLKLEGYPTKKQIACGIRPHYLDIDSVKDKAVKNKEESLCADEVINEKIRKNEPVETSQLESQETTDNQNILLSAAYELILRLYLHDSILRGIVVFGYYDPQILRENQLFIDFLAAQIESEMRSNDDILYNMMITFFAKQVIVQTGNEEIDITNPSIKKKILKDTIKGQLKNNVLPKLSKRILEDTNEIIRKKITNNPIQIKTTLLDKKSDFRPLLDLFFEEKGRTQKTVHLKYEVAKEFLDGKAQFNLGKVNVATAVTTNIGGINTGVTVTVDQGAAANPVDPALRAFFYTESVIFNGSLDEFSDSLEGKILFEYLFPLKTYVTILFITNNLSTSTRKLVLDAFRGTKKELAKVTKSIQANGQPIAPDLGNPQSVANQDTQDSILWFIIKQLIETPINVAKAFIEGADPNAALSSGIYKAAKLVQPEISSFIIPTIGVPLGFWFASPFMFNPFNIIYYGLGLWYDDANSNQKNKSDEEKRKYIESLINDRENSTLSCKDEKNNDIVTLTGQDELYRPVKTGE